jgi:hypothetical protein
MVKHVLFIMLMSITTSACAMEKKLNRWWRDTENRIKDTFEDAGELLNEGEKLLFEDTNTNPSTSRTSPRSTTPLTRGHRISPSRTSNIPYLQKPNSKAVFSLIRSSLGLTCSSITLLIGLKNIFNEKGSTFGGLCATIIGSAGCCAMSYNLIEDFSNILRYLIDNNFKDNFG